MTSFATLLILPPGAARIDDGQSLGDAVAEALAPYREDAPQAPYRRRLDAPELGSRLAGAVQAGRVALPDGLALPQRPSQGSAEAPYYARMAAFGAALADELGPTGVAACLSNEDEPFGVDDVGPYECSSVNPRGYHDYYRIGGSYSGELGQTGPAGTYRARQDGDVLRADEWDARVYGDRIEARERAELHGLPPALRAERLMPWSGDEAAHLRDLRLPAFLACIDADGEWHDAPDRRPWRNRDSSVVAVLAFRRMVLAHMTGADPASTFVLLDCHS